MKKISILCLSTLLLFQYSCADILDRLKLLLADLSEEEIPDALYSGKNDFELKPGLHEKGEIIFTHPKSKIIFKVKIGDLTKQPVDAIVNASNDALYVGPKVRGVSGAIRKAVNANGNFLLVEKEIKNKTKESKTDSLFEPTLKQRCAPGNAVITNAHFNPNNPIKYIVHAVGPNWYHYDEHQKNKAQTLLYQAYYNALKKAARTKRIKTIAFPLLSSMIFGFSNLDTTKANNAFTPAIEAINDFVAHHKRSSIQEIQILFLNPKVAKAFIQAVLQSTHHDSQENSI